MPGNALSIPDWLWHWAIAVGLVAGGFFVKIVRDALLQKNADLIVRQLMHPDNSGISPLQRLIRDEMIQHEIAMSGISKQEQRRRREIRESQSAGPTVSTGTRP